MVKVTLYQKEQTSKTDQVVDKPATPFFEIRIYTSFAKISTRLMIITKTATVV